MWGYSGNDNVIKKITKKKKTVATLNKGGSSKVNLLKGFLTTTGPTSTESTIKQNRTLKKLENSMIKQNLGITKFSDQHIININVPVCGDRVSLSDRLVNTITD